MVSTIAEDEPLDLQLFSEDDDEDDKVYKKMLHALVTGELSPPTVAADFDAWIMRESNRRLELLMKRADQRNLTPEEEASGMTTRMISPNASGYIEEAFPTIARLCSAFPPGHAGQDRIVQFLESLRAMPEHRAPDAIPEGSDDGYMTLWPLGGSWQALPEVFRREAADYFSPHSTIHVPGGESRRRWRNLQAAMARLTAARLVDCGFLCALEGVLLLPPGGSGRVGGHAVAGAQWVLRDDAGRYVYARCCRRAGTESGSGTGRGPRDVWTAERWALWKGRLEDIAGGDGDGFDDEARAVAGLAARRMRGLEEEEEEYAGGSE